MLKSCKYCGRVHDTSYVCNQKPRIKKPEKFTEARKIRGTRKWQVTREHIKERDNYLCQVCLRNIHDLGNTIEHKGLQVHHNAPLEEQPERAYDDDNLITLCAVHHSMAEKGIISRDTIQTIIDEQNDKAKRRFM